MEGHTTQTLYGTRTWSGRCTSPLLFAGQYEDAESGWAYNRFRYYNPTLGAYNAQDHSGSHHASHQPRGMSITQHSG
ncbi:RHS repeat-associated core domain-containing protein [Corynebacterium macclintockiae]|uniref:RHS repeat-associated core domain-containing protein n=1 Tax=Corynebacterium macclintockiae TaxID=2913501 RepID=UPI003D710662